MYASSLTEKEKICGGADKQKGEDTRRVGGWASPSVQFRTTLWCKEY